MLTYICYKYEGLLCSTKYMGLMDPWRGLSLMEENTFLYFLILLSFV